MQINGEHDKILPKSESPIKKKSLDDRAPALSSLSTCIFCVYTDFCSVGILQCCCNSKTLHPRDLTYSICLNIRQADSIPQNNEKLTYERKLFGGSGLQVHAILQPEEFGIWDAVGVAVEAGRYSRLLGLRLWIDQDHWRDWTHKHKQNQKTGREERGERKHNYTLFHGRP